MVEYCIGIKAIPVAELSSIGLREIQTKGKDDLVCFSAQSTCICGMLILPNVEKRLGGIIDVKSRPGIL